MIRDSKLALGLRPVAAVAFLLGLALPLVISTPSAGAKGPPGSEGTVGCQAAIIGQGPRDWRRHAIVAGPVAVNRRPPPLSFMSPSPGGTKVTKMMLMVIGHRPVRVSAPVKPNRIWLYYGHRASSFAGKTKYRSVVLHPCKDQRRTVFPGGIRVRGHKPVRLNVSVLGGNTTYRLRLGKPRTLRVIGRTMSGWVLGRSIRGAE